MAKQKFRCEGVVRKTGQRVAVEVMAESREIAVKMADQHGVTVQRIGLAQGPKPADEDAASCRVGKRQDAASTEDLDDNDEKVDGLLDPLDPADPFDLAAAAGPALSAAPSMKACPYCGEPILAVAIKCKHCGTVLPVAGAKARQPQQAVRSPGVSRSMKLILVSAAVGLVLLSVGGWAIYHYLIAPVNPAVSTFLPPPPPTPPPPAPKVEAPKTPAEEAAFASRLVAFLDACDATTRLLEGVPKLDAYRKQCDSLQGLHAAIATPPKGVPWAESASNDAKQLLEVPIALNQMMGMVEETYKALGQPVSDSPEVRNACHDAAAKMRELSKLIRGQIPPACLPKG